MGGTISHIIKEVDDGAKQIIFQIDPSILKLKNTSLISLDDLENKLHSSSEQYLISLRENVYIWLILILTFVILVLILIYYLNDILYNLRFNIFTRQLISLFVLTIITFWIFFVSICSIFLNKHIDWFILKCIGFSVFFLFCFFLILIWVRFISIHRRRNKKKFISYI